MKRYDLENTASRMSYETHYDLVEASEGEWVRFEDVEPLIRALRVAASAGPKFQPDVYDAACDALTKADAWVLK